MKDKEFDIFGIGSPLVDMFFETDDEQLIEFKLIKGQMHLINHENFSDLKLKIKKNPIKTSIAGDIVNTVMGVASMGGRAVFCGKVGKDEYANMFEEVLISDNIKPALVRCNTYYTGQVISFVTSDAQRTMTVHLGAAVGLKKEEATLDDIKKSRFLYTSAYVFDSPDLKDTVMHALKIAKDNGVKIAFDLADSGVISRHKETIQKVIEEYVDVLFANETEAEKFTGEKDPKIAIDILSKLCRIAVVKLGENGSLVKRGEEVVDVKIIKRKAIDSTGAGDMYAAGFLFALNRTNDLELVSEVASYASAKIVEQFGAKLKDPIKDDVEKILEAKK